MSKKKQEREMTPRERKFCEFFASGFYSKAGAAREAGYNPAGAGDIGSRLLKRPDIKKLVTQLLDEDKAFRALDGEYVKQQLGKIAHRAEGSGQYTEALSALDKLGKVHGLYEKDNQQKAAVSLKMEF